MLAKAAAPDVEPSLHCFDPYDCEFWDHCTAAKPADWIVGGLPGLNGERLTRLRDAGIERITDIPDDFRLGPAQARIRAAWLAGGLHLEPGLAAALRRTGPPALYLDFETAFPAIPLYAGMRPYQQMPVPVVAAPGGRRSGGCCTANSSPTAGPIRAPPSPRRCSRRCATGAGPSWCGPASRPAGSAELAEALPEHAAEIARVRARLVDLHPIVRGHVGHPEFGGSFSLKRWRRCSRRRSPTTTSTA